MFVAWRSNLWHGGQICGNVAKSVHGHQICGTAAKSGNKNCKFVYKRTKNSNIYRLPCNKEAKQKLNFSNKDVRIVYAKMCTTQDISGHIYYFLSEPKT